MPNTNSTSEITFTKVAELYLDELRDGMRPSLDAYIQAFPHLSQDILGYFPTLAALETVPAKVELSEGDKLGNFIIQSEIGRGGMGIVYRAISLKAALPSGIAEQEVAIKVLPLRMSDEKLVKRFEQERLAMTRLSHPNVLPVYDHGFNDNYAYLVLKLINGNNLAQLLKIDQTFSQLHPVISNWRSDWGEFARIASEIASGIQHAHGKGLIHRDIKPGNLLIDHRGKIWISDFGLAKLWDSAHAVSQTGDVIGTPRYMAPEQSQGICDARSDIYSLGVTLYELACGQRACFGQSLGSIAKNRESLAVRDVRSINPNVPPELAKIIMRACEYLPTKRYQTAKEFKFVLDRYRCGHEKADRRKRTRVSDFQFKQRSRQVIVGSATAIVITTGLIISWLGIRSSHNEQVFGESAISSPASPRSLIAATLSPRRGNESPDAFGSPSQKVIDQLASGNQNDVVEVVSSVLSQSIRDHSVQHWNYTEEAKNQLLDQVNEVTSLFRENKLSTEDMDRFVLAYRDSSVAIASRLLQIVPQIEKSLTANERIWALGVTARYSSAIINQAVSPSEAMQYIDGIVRGRFNSIEESQAVAIPRQELLTWLNFVQSRLTTLPADSMRRHKAPPKELQELFRQHFGIVPNSNP